ncbi:hypothetical protein DTO169E5_987 [Paecilomyces variotii]|nr:hypothetical protein DTO169E5_987 [Paecilomyces variotii]
MMNGREPLRGYPPSNVSPPKERRPMGDARNGSGPRPGDGSMSRAEKFEDEKRRIVRSCFSKQDSDGSVAESYITHIRITEDAAYPSSPAPPNSAPDNKKARVIIVAVRRSGRVRMHKARENSDGSFSIGKTWMLDDLSAIQTYTALQPTSPQEQQYKQWASNVGFVVTIGKPYYWQAATAKEKDFFIGSLVKIYKKYTAGKVPNLIGFDERERLQLLGAGSAAASGAKMPPQAAQRPDAALPPPRPPSPRRPQSPYSGRAPSRDGNKDARRQRPDEPMLRSQRSREQMGRPPVRPGQQLPVPALSSSRDQPPARPERPERPEGIAMQESRPPPSRDGKGMVDLRLGRTRDAAPDYPRDKETLRPTTPASVSEQAQPTAQSPAVSLGQRTMLSETTGRDQAPSRGSDRLQTRDVSDYPSSLRPGSSSSSILKTTSALSAEAQAEAEAEAEAEEQAQKEKADDLTLPLQGTTSEPATEPAVVATPAVQPLERSATEPTADQAQEEEAHRPGLGPMVKKKPGKDLAGALRKAATAYGAFKPRAGGAAERLMAAAKKSAANEPDGITGVVPAPLLRGTSNDSMQSAHTAPETPLKETPTLAPAAVAPAAATPVAVTPSEELPTFEITQPAAEQAAQVAKDEALDASKEVTEERSRSKSPSPSGRRRKRREDRTAKYCEALGIDPAVLEGRGAEFDDILTDLGWNGRLSDDKKIEDLEADVRREIGRVQASSWLGNLEQQEGKVDQLAKLIDKTIEECEELDGLLTLYSHELNTLNDDVAFIEAQSQGLQVQTANQKLLQNELQNLLKTLSISSDALQPLKEASLSNPDGIKETEVVLSTLYKALLMIDSNIGQNKKRMADAAGEQGSIGIYADTEVGQMRAIREKKEEYRSEARLFLQRLRQFMSIAFKMAEQKVIDAANSASKDPLRLDSAPREAARQELWIYNALMLFAREVSTSEWNGIIGLYEQEAKGPYQNEFRENNFAWKKAAKKPTGDEHELLFTHQEKEKESEGITTAARKLTVRRGKTMKIGQGLRPSLSGEKQGGKLEPCEVFAGTLQETVRSIAEEQNFIVQFFHLNSLTTVEFPDLVAGSDPERRRKPDMSVRQMHDPDREMARKVEQIMDDIYAFWPNDVQSLVDWAIKSDQLQGVGILHALEKAITDFEDTNQEFIVHSLQKLHTRLSGLFSRFVDDQIRGIEETKVKVNKRKGVISFMRTFPNFSAAIENMLAAPEQDFSDIRLSVNEAYNKINQAMWESLKFIAKEAPGQQPGATTGAGDPEDKEALNYHILLIENMNHYVEEVDVRGIPVLERWRERAIQDMDEHMRLYMDAVIRRPLGKLLEFVESTESLMATTSNPADVASRASHSRSVAKKVFASYDAKEVRRGAELLRKRVEKHFGESDDTTLSRNLVAKVLQECEARYASTYDRTLRIIDTVYEGQLDLEWRKEEATAMFKR